jgi:uncharacterized protein
MLRSIYLSLVFSLGLFLLPQSVLSQDPVNMPGLTGLSELKVYFDVKADSAAKLDSRLQWIFDTYEQVSKKGVRVDIVIGFRSKASFFVTSGDEYIDEADIPLKRKIENWLKRFHKMKIPMVQCGLSAKLLDIELDEFLPEITVVKNGYISIAGYQNKGYAYVPM